MIKNFNKFINEGMYDTYTTYSSDYMTDTHKYRFQPKTREELEQLVDHLIYERGYKADLNDIDTSLITNMEELFYGSQFNGDISKWDVSNVKNMSFMFASSIFNGDISNWNVGNVEDMCGMFYQSPLKNNPPKWYKA